MNRLRRFESGHPDHKVTMQTNTECVQVVTIRLTPMEARDLRMLLKEGADCLCMTCNEITKSGITDLADRLHDELVRLGY